MPVYREFPSKDALVVAWLERSRDDVERKAAEAIAPFAGDPAAQLVALVRAEADEVAARCPHYRGCALRNTLNEFPDADHPARKVVVAQQEARRAQLRDLAAQAGAGDPDALADRIVLVLDGLLTSGSVLGPTGPARAAVALAEQIVRDAVTGAATPAGR